MGVTTGPDEIAHFQIALLRHHMDQQRIAGNIERQAEEHVARALIQLAREFAVRHIKLEEGMARCQSHLIQLTHVPGRNNNTARVRVLFQLLQYGA
ncbi:hypothetical protein D3C78_1287390 [compost metagenome]